MQILKDEVRNNILQAAKSEFLNFGYERASIKGITRAAHTSTSNVYNYFFDKDALFAAVTENTRDSVHTFFHTLNNPSLVRQAETYTMNAQKEVIAAFVKLFIEHQEGFQLLLFRSAGSSLSGYKDEVVGMLADALARWIAQINSGRQLSRFFVVAIARFYIGVMEQLLLEKNIISIKPEHFEEFLLFVYGGWNKILQSPSGEETKSSE